MFFSEGYSLLSTLVVLLSVSVVCCSVLSFQRRSLLLCEKKLAAFDSELSEKNRIVEDEWFGNGEYQNDSCMEDLHVAY